MLSDLHRGEQERDIHMDLIAPLSTSKQETDRCVGAIVLQIDPQHYLYPYIQEWPTPSPTAETLIVRREGDKVLFLNEIRHRKNTALSLQLPITEDPIPVVMAIRGREGIVEGFDYRGEPVLAVIKNIPDFPWLLVAKVDKEEIFSPIYQIAWIIAIIAVVLIALAGVTTYLITTKLSAKFYRTHLALNQRYEFITKYANDIIVLADNELRIVEANNRALEAYGHSRDELMRMTIRDLRVPESRPLLNGQVKAVKEHNGLIYETEHLHKDGTAFPVESSSRIIDIEGKQFYQFIIRNITERKESESRYQAVIEAANDAIVSADSSGTIIGWNAAAERIFGYSADEAVGQPYHIVVPERMRESQQQEFMEAAATGQSGVIGRVVEIVGLRKDGTEFPEEVSFATWHSKRGRFFAAVLRDISERRRAEEEKAKLQAQLFQSQKMEAVGHLAGGIAHDFNNILSAIIGYASFLKMKVAEDDPAQSDIQQILTASERAASLVQSILAFSKKQLIDPKPVTLNEIVSTTEELLRRLIGEDIELVSFLTEEDTTVIADSSQVVQVLMNLTTNARDAMPDGGQLSIETERVEIDDDYIKTHGYGIRGSYVQLSITDSGVGMDKETMKQVFEPFFTTKEVGKGTGLGLSMVYGIVKQHNGYINCYSEPGAGTTFKIYMPAAPPVSEAEEKTGTPAPLPPGGTETVLLAEDDAAVRELIRQILEVSGYTIFEAANGEDAVRMFNDHKDEIHLLLFDVIMPQKNGKEAYEEIKKVKPDVKIIFTSGYTANIIHKRGFLSEGYDIILKPAFPHVLLQKVREVLDRQGI